jgi:hypothetical protein
MKRVLVCGMLALTLVVGVTVAEAAISKGSFKGKTSASDPLGFKVSSKNQVVNFYFEGVGLSCTDGDQFDTGTGSERLSSLSRKFRISRTRKFEIHNVNGDAGARWDVKGQFNRSGSKATGTIRVQARFDEQNQADPEGSIRCDSTKLPFTAKRR